MAIRNAVPGDRIFVYQGSQDDPSELQKICREVGRPKIVIDDGSHFSHHLRASFQELFPSLEIGGIYALEDLQTSYWPKWWGRGSTLAPLTSMAMVKDLLDGLNHEEIINRKLSFSDKNVTAMHCSHNLVLVEKGPNQEGSNREKANPRRLGGEGRAPWKTRLKRAARWVQLGVRDAMTAARSIRRRNMP